MSDTIVALDLGTTHLRGVEAQIKKGNLPKVIKIHSIPLEMGIVSSGMITDKDSLTSALKKLWTEAKFSSKKVIGMATGVSYDNRVLADIPWAPPEDFKKMLPYILKDRLPYDINDYYFDSHTLDEYYKPENNDSQLYKRVLVAGVDRKFTDAFIGAVEGAGLIPIGLDFMPLALIRVNSVNTEAPTGAVIVSIDLGGDITTIVVHQDNQPQYINTAAPLGGVRITEEISKELHITVPEAEMIKISFSVPPEERANLSATTYYEDGSTKQTSINEIPEHIINEAEKIISREAGYLIGHMSDILDDAFTSRSENPFEIVLTGRGSALHSLTERIQTEIGVPVRILKPLQHINTKKIPERILEQQEGYSAIYGLLVGQNGE